MNLNKLLTHVSVIGASGKMGRGISLLLLQEMSMTELSLQESAGKYCLNLIDLNPASYHDLKNYLREQILKFAEKNIIKLRDYYSKNLKLISNRDIIEDYVRNTLDIVHFSDSIEKAADSYLIFEAITEDIQTKVSIFSKIKSKLKNKAYFFTNTSSIPIHVLESLSGLSHDIVGFHFYNPPAIQKLVELIIPKDCNPELKTIAEELVKRLKKKAIYSNDAPGFIGNGHFMREIVFACKMAKEYGIDVVDAITKDFLLRPMGIFQLMDYVGLDICSKVLKIMQEQIPDKTLHADLIDQMILNNKLGGQTPKGDQNPGFFEYEGLNPKAVYSLEKQAYVPLDQFLKPVVSFKSLQNDSEKAQKIEKYFEDLKKDKSQEAKIALQFLENSNKIGRKLVQDGVAKNIEDVSEVLINGFYHLYGVNDK